MASRPIRLAGLAVLVSLAAVSARAQFPVGDSDGDGLVVPTFLAPGGAVSIENGGQSTVSIPLAVPPGVRGLGPRLALTYSSGAADDGLGVGWSLDLGYPDAVRRTTRFGVPHYDDRDVFTYAGQDLVPTPGTNRYRTRVDSYVRIEHEVFLHGLSRWVVTTKDGSRLEYGTSDNSRSGIAGLGRSARIYAWHLQRVVDTFGNAMELSYDGPAQARRLLRIRYTLSGNTPIGQEQRVDLVWEARPDPRRSSSYGEEILRGARVSRIETSSAGAAVMAYDLVYAGEPESGIPLTPATRVFRLMALRQTGAAGGPSLAWGFAYQDRPPGWAAEGGPHPPLPFRALGFFFSDPAVRLGDLNGDGFTDVVGKLPSESTARVWIHKGQSWELDASWSVPYTFTDKDGDRGERLIDANGDGLVDLARGFDPNPGVSGDEIQEVRLNLGTRWDAPNTAYRLPPGVIFVHRRSWRSPSGIRYFTSDAGVRLGDVNGDGRIDIVQALEGGARGVYLNNGVNGWDSAGWDMPFDLTRHDPQGGDVSEHWGDNGVDLVDVNADGLADLVRAYKEFDAEPVREIRLNTGSGWGPPGAFTLPGDVLLGEALSRPPYTYYRDGGSRFADLDGDGYPDVLFKLASFSGDDLGSKVYLNNQTNGFVEAEGWEVPLPTVLENPRSCCFRWDAGTRIFDVDGDGAVDLVHEDYRAQGTFTWLPRSATHLALARTDLLTGYVSPLGGELTLSYGSTNGLGLPAGRMPIPRTVAEGLREDAGMGDPVVTREFEYRNGLYDPLRREFRGYAKVLETRADGSVRERDFYQDEGRRGVESSDMLRDGDGKYYYAHPQFVSSVKEADGIYVTHLDRELFVRFDQDDQSQWVRSGKEYRSYDAFGNPREVLEAGYSEVVERSTRVTFVVNDASYLVLPARIERFTGAFETPLAVEELCYDHQACDAPPLRGALTRRILTDHRLEGLTLMTGSSRVETQYEHDAYGNVTRERNGRGFTTTFDYAGNGYLFPHTTTRDNPGGPTLRTVSVYDLGLGTLRQRTALSGAVTTYEYDPLGRLTSIQHPDDAPGDPTVRATYELGSLPAYMEVQEKLDATRTRTRREYLDGLGRAKARVRGAGAQWTLSGLTDYDNRGRPRRTFEPFFRGDAGFPASARVGPVTVYEYEDDRLSVTTHPDDAVTQSYYTRDGVIFADENQVRTLRRYDAFGQLVEVVTDLDQVGPDPSTQTTSHYAYDGLGRLTSARSAITLQDPQGRETRYFYDARGLLRGVSGPDGSQAPRNGHQVFYDYDEQGNVTYRWSGDKVRRVEYDAVDRTRRSYLSHDRGVHFFGESEHTYDGGTNGIGRLSRVDGYGAPRTWSELAYDVRGRVTEERFNLQALDASLLPFSVGYAYDREGSLLGIRDPRGYWTRYARNALGQLDRSGATPAVSYAGPLALEVADFEYDASERTTAIQFADGGTDAFRYDARGRMREISGGGPLQVTYAYDAAGNLRTESHSGRPFELAYRYDALGRLIRAEGTTPRGAVGADYRYDAASNLLGVAGPGPTNLSASLHAGTNRLASFQLNGGEPIQVAYDPQGNVVRMEDAPSAYLRALGYDALERLRLWENEKTNGSIVYDGRSRKVARTLPSGAREIYVHTTGGEVLATYARGRWTSYLLADGRRLGLLDAGGRDRYLRVDRLGSARAMVAGPAACSPPTAIRRPSAMAGPAPRACDPPGTVVWRGDYFPYGEEVEPTPGGDDFRFTGQEIEASLELYDYGARYYHPLLGRFVQLDTVLGFPEEPRSLNRYAYALGNPTRFTDPEGRCPICIVAVVAAVGALVADMIDPNPANAPSPRDVEEGRVYEGKSDAQFAGEQAIGAGAGAVLGTVLGKVAPAIARKLGPAAGEAVREGVEEGAEAAGRTFTATSKGIVVSSELLEKQGTSKLAGSFANVEGATVEEVVSRVPKSWTMVAQNDNLGMKFLDEAGFERLRLHGPSATAPAGSNAASGWTLRVMDRAGNYYDAFGNMVQSRFANAGHIPIFGNPKAP